MVYTGANFIVATLNDTTLTPVGVGVKVGTFEENYSLDRAFGIGDRVADVMYSKGFEGSMSFDAIMSEDGLGFLSAWINENSLNEIELHLVELNGNVLASNVSVASDYKIVGWKADSVKITARAGEYIGLSFDGKFRYVQKEDNLTYTLDVSSLTDTPYIFASASVSSGGLNINYNIVKDFEIDIKHNIEVLRALNDLYPVVLQEQKYEVDATLNVYVDTTTWNELLTNLEMPTSGDSKYTYGYYPNSDVVLSISNGSKTHTFTLKVVGLNSYSTSFEDANVVEGSLKLVATRLEYS